MHHVWCPEEARVNNLPKFARMSCFKISHQDECNNLFVKVSKGGKTYTWSITKQPIVIELTKSYNKIKDKNASRRGRPWQARAQSTSDIDDSSDTDPTKLPAPRRPPQSKSSVPRRLSVQRYERPQRMAQLQSVRPQRTVQLQRRKTRTRT